MLSNIPVTWRMMLSALLPTLALLFFAGSLILEEWDKSREMSKVEHATRFTRDISQLIHELQRERGRSAGFIGAQGDTAYRRALETQRNSTDAAIVRYQAGRSEISRKLRDEHLDSTLGHVDELLAGLQNHRTEIDSLNMALGQAVGLYTETISTLIEEIAEMSHIGNDSDLSSQLIGMLNLVSAKESAGIERAIGSNIYATGVITPELHQRAVNLVARQDAYFLEFRELMGDRWSERLDAVLSQPESLAVDEARIDIRDAGYGGALANMTGAEWFDLTTQRIELLMELETEVANSIIDQTTTLRAQAQNLAVVSLIITTVGLVVAIGGAIGLMLSVVRPLMKITNNLNKLASGDTGITIEGADRGDEIGVLARTAEAFRQATHDREVAMRERAASEQKAFQERRKVLSDMAASVEKATLESVGSVADAAQSLNASSDTIRATLETAGQTASQVTNATEQNVKHTGRAAELASELSSAIGEVTQQITRGDSLARNAISEAERSRQSVEELNEAAQQISDFIGLITDIAEQTNLLALNATIEAARAGDAGKGFAVVASEVKALAAQTNQSTTQIAERVAHIQSRTQSTVEAMNAITQSIENIGEVTASVAAAMEEQSASTGSLSSFVEQNRQALARVSSDIAELVQMTTRSAQDAENMASLVKTMADTANDANSSIPRIVQQAVAAAENRQEERRPSQYNAEILVNGQTRKATLIDASSLGLRISCVGLKEGQSVKLISPALNENATVIWANADEAGLQFAQAISKKCLLALLEAGAQEVAA